MQQIDNIFIESTNVLWKMTTLQKKNKVCKAVQSHQHSSKLIQHRHNQDRHQEQYLDQHQYLQDRIWYQSHGE